MSSRTDLTCPSSLQVAHRKAWTAAHRSSLAPACATYRQRFVRPSKRDTPDSRPLARSVAASQGPSRRVFRFSRDALAHRSRRPRCSRIVRRRPRRLVPRRDGSTRSDCKNLRRRSHLRSGCPRQRGMPTDTPRPRRRPRTGPATIARWYRSANAQRRLDVPATGTTSTFRSRAIPRRCRGSWSSRLAHLSPDHRQRAHRPRSRRESSSVGPRSRTWAAGVLRTMT